jgi:hypothetical protein
MSNSRKYQIRNAGVGADLTSGTNNYKLNRTTGAYDTFTDDASVTTSDIVIIGKKSNISDRLDAVEKNITVLAAAAFLTDAEDGIAGTYTIANKLLTPRTIALTGDVTGSVSFDGSSNATISTTIGANTVVLGTDTTGNYIATVTAGSGITVSGSGSETAAITVGIDSTVALKADAHFIGTTSVALNRASANLALTGISSVTLPGSSSGSVQVIPAATAGTGTVLTLPATTGTVVTTGDSGTVTNTMLAGSISNAKLSNSAVTIGTTAISLGASSTTLAGLTSVTSTAFTGALTGNVTGNASTATTLQTARLINGVSFNGSADVTVHTAGTGISISGTTVTNAGVTSAVAGTGISVSGATGAVTVTNTGVTSIAGTANQITASASTGGVTLSLPSAVTVPGDLTVTGNLTVNGTSTTISATNLSISDALIYLASGNSGNSNDIGFVGHFNNGTYQHTGLARSAADGKWRLFSGVTTEPQTAGTITLTDPTFAIDTLKANTEGTHTGAVSGNATTATTLQTARLINGVSFNGSADVTVHTAGTGISVSGTTVTNTGIITASAGTGISVSGTNPLTITNTGVTSLAAGTNISLSGSTGAVTVNVTGTVASATAIPSYDRDRSLASTLPTTFGQSVRFDFVNASAIGTSGNYGGVMTFAPYTGTSASTGDASYQLAFGSTATNGSGTPRLRIRNGIDSTWNSFYEVLTAANYNSYSPTLTGTGASGTWGINVTGTAGSISGYNNPTTAATANTIVYRDGSGHITGNYGFYGYLNTSDDVNTGSVTYIMAKFGDNYHRSASAAKVAAFLSGQSMNISGSSTSCSGNSSTATTATNTSGGTVNGNYLGVQNTSGGTGYGLSLYNGAVAGQPTYGIFFGQTASWGTHGNVTADWATYFTMDSTANRGWIFRDTTNGNKASISNTGNATFAGEVTAYSDARLKTNIVTIDKALDKVVKLRGVYFDKDGKRQIGVIAQEIREVFPEVVGEANDEMKTLHVNHGAMVGALIESTKDLNDKIEAQAKEIAELKALVKELLSTK